MLSDDPISTKHIINSLRAAKKHMIYGCVIGVILSAILIATLQQKTRIDMLISPAQNLNSDSYISDKISNALLLRAFSQAAGGTNAASFNQFLATFYSPQTAAELLKDPETLKTLQQDRTFSFTNNNQTWTPARLSEYLKKKVLIKSQGITSMKHMQYWHPNPQLGERFLRNIQKIADKNIRLETARIAAQRIQHLKQQLQTTQHNSHINALNQLLLEQQRTLMLSSIDNSYATKIISPASAFYKPQWPSKPLLIILLTLIGAALGYFLYSFKNT